MIDSGMTLAEASEADKKAARDAKKASKEAAQIGRAHV